MISLRLKTIGDMVTTSNVIDVGCDHALLSIYLAKKNISSLAIDVNSYAILKAKESVALNKLEDSITLLVNDGLDNINISNSSTVTLSGLGTNTILHIIGKRHINNLIISSNNDLPLLRKSLVKNGYYIKDEKVIIDKHIHYVIISFGLGHKKYNRWEYLYGPIVLKNNILNKDYFEYLKDIDNGILRGMPIKHLLRRYQLKKEIKYLDKVIRQH